MTKLCFPVVLVVDSTQFTLITLFHGHIFSFDCANLTYFTIHSTIVAQIVIRECMAVQWCRVVTSSLCGFIFPHRIWFLINTYRGGE